MSFHRPHRTADVGRKENDDITIFKINMQHDLTVGS
jgi:hypothetical protein